MKRGKETEEIKLMKKQKCTNHLPFQMKLKNNRSTTVIETDQFRYKE